MDFKLLSELFKRVKGIKTKNLVLILCFCFPLVLTNIFKSEISKYIFARTNQSGATSKLVVRLHALNNTLKSDGVVMYKYTGKTKELVYYASNKTNTYTPVKRFDLSNQIEITKAFDVSGYFVATPETGSYISNVLNAYDFQNAYFVPILNLNSEVTGELVVFGVDLSKLDKMYKHAQQLYFEQKQ